MKLAKLFHSVDRFFKLAAESEELPEDSKDIKKVLKNLSKIETHSVRVEYAERNLDHLSSGTSRVVFTLPGKKEVLKLAKNDRGIAQNEAEAGLTCKYVNKTLQACPNDYWKTSPFLDKITEKEFEELTGANFKDFGEAIEYELKDVSGSKVDKPKKLGRKHDLMPADMSRISSWGKIDGHPTLLDAGLTREIYDEFY